MADLHWFPFFAKDWLSSPARMAMLPEQRGAYMDLLCVAWGSGTAVPSLPDDDAQLAAQSGLGARWKKLGALIRAQFIEHDGRLVNERLSAIWWEQQEKHASAVAKASAGGRAKAAKQRAARGAQGVLGVVLEAEPGQCSNSAESESESERTLIDDDASGRVLPGSVVSETDPPSALDLAIWVNHAVGEQWPGTTRIYTAGGAASLERTLRGRGVPGAVAHKSIYRQTRASRNQIPPSAPSYFETGILQDFERAVMGRTLAGARADAPPRNGRPSTGEQSYAEASAAFDALNANNANNAEDRS